MLCLRPHGKSLCYKTFACTSLTDASERSKISTRPTHYTQIRASSHHTLQKPCRRLHSPAGGHCKRTSRAEQTDQPSSAAPTASPLANILKFPNHLHRRFESSSTKKTLTMCTAST